MTAIIRGAPGSRIGSSVGGTSSLNQLQNSLALQLPKIRAGVARVKAGTGNARWAMCGDSTTRGHGALGFPNTGNYLYSPAAYLSNMFNANGINAHFNGTFGADASSSGKKSDARIAVTGGFTASGGNSFGGPMFLSNATGTIAYTPIVNVDSFFIFYLQQATAGSFTYNINGGSNTTVTTTGTAGMKVITVTPTTLGANTLNINWVSGQVFVNGFWAYDSSKKWVQIDNGGFEGSTTAQWVGTTNAYDPMSAAVALTAGVPDLISISLGINDWDGTVSLATYSANLQSLVTKAMTTSDVILISPNPSNPGAVAGTPSNAVQATYAATMAAVASSNNIPFIDNFSRMGSYAITNANGMNFDGLHPNSVGYADIGQAIFNMIGNV